MKFLLVLVSLLTMLAGCGKSGGDKVVLPGKGAGAPRSGAAAASAPASTGEPSDVEVPSDKLLRATGATAPHRTSKVAAVGQGLVEEILVREGDMVQAGDVLARLDRSDTRLRLKQAEAQRRLAAVQVAAAKRELDRLSKLTDEKALPAAQLDQARTAFDAANAQADLAEASLALVRKMERDAEVKAPFAGLVVERMAAEGEWVSTMPPSPILRLVEISPLDLSIDVSEQHLSRLRVGDKVRARIDAAGDVVVDGTITRIVPFVKPGTRSFSVVVEIPNVDGALKPGVFAEVEIEPAGGGQ